MKTLIIAALIGVATIANTQARPGDTYQQSVERFGQPLKKEDNIAVFEKAGYRIAVIYHTGKSVVESYMKLRKKGFLEIQEEFTDAEIEYFKNALGEGKNWKDISDFEDMILIRDDNKVRLQYKKVGMQHNMAVFNLELIEDYRNQKKQKELKQMDSNGF